MTESFRPWRVNEAWLLPPSVQEFVPEGHAAHLVRDTVTEELDLAAILSPYTEPRGYPPYHPAMMVALLLYAYSRGVYSSRRIARACEERLDFQAVTALNRPDFRTISEFRRRHLAALAELFVQVLAMCQRAGLVGLGHVAVDGTKLRANASRHKAMSYARMGPAEADLAAEVEGWLAQAEGRTPRRTPLLAPTGAATRCRPGCATSGAAWSGSAPRRRNSRPRRGRPRLPSRTREARRTARRAGAAGASRSTRPACRSPPHSATSPIRRAGS